MQNLNGELVQATSDDLSRNRGFLYGDGVFETIKVLDGKPLFFEDHYFRLMAAMRIVRMEIPMAFTMEYLERQLLSVTDALGISASARVRMTVFRNSGGLYRPTDNTVSWLIQAEPTQPLYAAAPGDYEIELYKDFYVTRQLLSSLKTTNRMLHITAAVYAEENGYANCLLLNDDKNVTEAIQGNVFMLTGSRLVTPPVSEGCLNGVMRKQILEMARKMDGIEVIEEPISPFDLQKGDELFVTNVIMGVRPVTKYRKKEYGNAFASKLTLQLNAKLRFS